MKYPMTIRVKYKKPVRTNWFGKEIWDYDEKDFGGNTTENIEKVLNFLIGLPARCDASIYYGEFNSPFEGSEELNEQLRSN